jgi:hypothetical protein
MTNLYEAGADTGTIDGDDDLPTIGELLYTKLRKEGYGEGGPESSTQSWRGRGGIF